MDKTVRRRPALPPTLRVSPPCRDRDFSRLFSNSSLDLRPWAAFNFGYHSQLLEFWVSFEANGLDRARHPDDGFAIAIRKLRHACDILHDQLSVIANTQLRNELDRLSRHFNEWKNTATDESYDAALGEADRIADLCALAMQSLPWVAECRATMRSLRRRYLARTPTDEWPIAVRTSAQQKGPATGKLADQRCCHRCNFSDHELKELLNR